MDTAPLQQAFDGSSIVAWFALLVVVFVVFVGLGIYQSRRGQALSRDEALAAAASSARDLRKHPQPKDSR